MADWISVKDKLPDEALGKVLVAIDYDVFQAWAGDTDNLSFLEEAYNGPVDIWNTVAVRHWGRHANWLTHWMPLPDSPK